MTHDGIAEGSGIEPRHVPQYARPLIREGLVRERLAHVRGARQRRKVHDLTDSGRMTAVRLRENLKAQVVRVRDAQGVREAAIGQVLAEAREGVRLLDVIRAAEAEDPLDLRGFRPSGGVAFIEMISDAPRIANFVGRSKELSVLTNPEERARVFVVRGVAGIGKSSLASRVCELFHESRNLYWHRIRPWDTRSSILAALGEFLSALGRPGLRAVLSRGDIGQATQVLRADLPGTQSLLVFDDAHEATAEVLSVLRLLKETIAAAPDVRALILTRQSVAFYDRRDVVLDGLVRGIELEGLDLPDVRALLSAEGRQPLSAGLVRTFGGHPLFLELIRSAAEPTEASRARRDVLRFIEEEIYALLSDPERRMMKIASLYRVPVPRTALFADPSLSHDTVMSLAGRALLRTVGEGNFEVHETIRDYFSTVLTPAEQRDMGAFAIDQLRQLAAAEQTVGHDVAALDYLLNAVRLSSPGVARAPLLEALGDVSEKIGDLPGALTAYREGIKDAGDPEAIVRLHRKIASALEARGENASALAEIDVALRSLGTKDSIERAWLDLVKCRLAQHLEEWGEARERAEACLRTFQAFHALHGEAQALLEIGYVGIHAPDAHPSLAEECFMKARELSQSLEDPQLAARVHQMMFHFYVYHQPRQADRGMEAIAALGALSESLNLPRIRLSHLVLRGWFELDILADLDAAEADFRQAIVIARKVYDASVLADAKAGLASVAQLQGRFEEARRGFEQFAIDLATLGSLFLSGRLGGRAETMWMIAECSLLLGDMGGFRHVLESFDDPLLSRDAEYPVLSSVLRGIDSLVKGDEEGFRVAFEEAVQSGDAGFAMQEAPFVYYAHTAHFYYGVGLKVLGRDSEASAHLARAREMLEICRLKAWLANFSGWERRLTKVLRRRAPRGRLGDRMGPPKSEERI